MRRICVERGSLVFDRGTEKTSSPSHPYQPPHQQQQGSVYCYICQANVHKGTTHCRICSKCVAGFDHHCAWLNTCIGQSNYLFFICTLGSVLNVTALQAGMILLVLARWRGNLPHARKSPFALLSTTIQRPPASSLPQGTKRRRGRHWMSSSKHM